MTLEITRGTVPPEDGVYDAPPDEAPGTDDTEATGWFNAEYPHSTQEHPYGYFPDGKGGYDFSRPRKRRPHNRTSSGVSSVATSGRADSTARTAALMLARMNGLVGVALIGFGMPISGQALKDGNEVFKDMAYEALQADPVLARKILSAGASSAKGQLTMAYVMLGGSIAPLAAQEIKAKRRLKEEELES
jgi:hypothetical protein